MSLYYATKAKRNICSKRTFKIKKQNENEMPHFNHRCTYYITDAIFYHEQDNLRQRLHRL